MGRPQNVGIKAIEVYIPNQCVDQTSLEKFDGASEGKYTIGLGQKKMAFCDDREDIYSITLTAVSSLLRKYSIDPTSIGRLEVGTETLLDKSKSVKSVLMTLFSPSGNTNIEGVDTTNACYGGTSAFFNAVNWIESSAWDGRDAIVVAGDIALYAKGPARPTGGAGCVAMLVGPNAPIVVEEGLRGSYMKHVYDFYKPDLASEYPIVDGHFSVKCFLEAIDGCYEAYNRREDQLEKEKAGALHGGLTDRVAKGLSTAENGEGINGYYANHFNGEAVNGHINGATAVNGETYLNGNAPNGHANGVSGTNDEATTNGTNGIAPVLPIDRFDNLLFHAPMCKLVQKSYARLLYNDYLLHPTHPLFSTLPASIAPLTRSESLSSKDVEKAFLALSKKRFMERVDPTTEVPQQCGNMYCGSVYGCLAGLLANVVPQELKGRRVGVFSYGSGLASSLFSLRIFGDTTEMREKLDLHFRLAARTVVEPEVYDQMCELREKAHLKKNFTPQGDVDSILPGTYYLTGVDDMWRRSYAVKE